MNLWSSIWKKGGGSEVGLRRDYLGGDTLWQTEQLGLEPSA